MEPFIEKHQYMFMREKARQIVYARYTANDQNVRDTFIDHAQFYVYEQIETLTIFLSDKSCLKKISYLY